MDAQNVDGLSILIRTDKNLSDIELLEKMNSKQALAENFYQGAKMIVNKITEAYKI